jgi:hypothetical protein
VWAFTLPGIFHATAQSSPHLAPIGANKRFVASVAALREKKMSGSVAGVSHKVGLQIPRKSESPDKIHPGFPFVVFVRKFAIAGECSGFPFAVI